MKTYLTVDGRELNLLALNDSLSHTCLVLHGLRSLIETTLEGRDLGDREYGQLTVAELVLKSIALETENLLPDWPEAVARSAA